MKKYFVFLIVLLSAFYFSCDKKADSTSEKNKPEARVGGSIVIGVNNDVETLNPLFSESSFSQEVSHLILLGLADLDVNSEFKPELAESWESSEDYLKLTYHLRKDIEWSDGAPLTADDVKFTYDLLRDTTVASPRQGVCDFIKSVVVIDPHTVVFEFTEAYPTQVFDTAGEILPKHLLENVARNELRNHSFGREPLASGPFKIKKWVSQQFIELVPNEKYFEDRSYLDRIVFKIIPDKTNLLMQLKSGEIDMVSDVPAAEIEKLSKDNDKLKLYQVDGRVYYYLAYNEKNDLFTNISIRRALTMALDRQKIIDALLYGYGRPCLGPLPPMLKWAFNEEVKDFPYDPDQAKAIFSTAGWEDSNGDGVLDKKGRNFEFTIITSTGNQLKSDVAVVAQEQLGKIGVKINIEMLEWTTMIKKLQNKEFDACVNGWSTPYYVDPTPVFHSTSTGLFNFISYSNPQVDKLIETGRVEMDQEKAAEIWKEFHEVLYNDQPYTFLFWIDKAVAVNSKFHNVTPLALSSVYDLEKWYINQ